MPFLVVRSTGELSADQKDRLREALIGVFERHSTPREVTGVAISSAGSGPGRELKILTAMQPRPPETVESLAEGYARAVAELGYELARNDYVQVLPEDWPNPKWAT